MPLTGNDGKVSARPATPHRETAARVRKVRNSSQHCERKLERFSLFENERLYMTRRALEQRALIINV